MLKCLSTRNVELKKDNKEVTKQLYKSAGSMRDTLEYIGNKIEKMLHPVEGVNQDLIYEEMEPAQSNLNNGTEIFIKQEILSDEEDDSLGSGVRASMKKDDVKSVENGTNEIEAQQEQFCFVDACTRTEIKIEVSENDVMNDDFGGDSPSEYVVQQNLAKISETLCDILDSCTSEPAVVKIEEPREDTSNDASELLDRQNIIAEIDTGILSDYLNDHIVPNKAELVLPMSEIANDGSSFVDQQDSVTKISCSVDSYSNESPCSYESLYKRIYNNGRWLCQCSLCPKTYLRTRSLLVHMRSHTGERPFVCAWCQKGFVEPYRLQVHVRIHTGERPYICHQCHKTFTTSSSRWKHTQIHSGNRPFQCEHCFRTYSSKFHLERHIRVHTGEHPFKCELCDKTFSQSHNFERHFRTHTGERPYKCEQCDKAFKTNHQLKQHIRVHTGERPYKCKKCPKCFISYSNWFKHVQVRGHK